MNDNPVPAWEVVHPGREESHFSDTDTGMQQVFVVPYRITDGPARGHRGVVRVPPEDYNADGVRRHIDTAASSHHMVAGLVNPGA